MVALTYDENSLSWVDSEGDIIECKPLRIGVFHRHVSAGRLSHQVPMYLYLILPELDLHSFEFLSVLEVERPVHKRTLPLQKVKVIAYGLCVLHESLACVQELPYGVVKVRGSSLQEGHGSKGERSRVAQDCEDLEMER